MKGYRRPVTPPRRFPTTSAASTRPGTSPTEPLNGGQSYRPRSPRTYQLTVMPATRTHDDDTVEPDERARDLGMFELRDSSTQKTALAIRPAAGCGAESQGPMSRQQWRGVWRSSA